MQKYSRNGEYFALYKAKTSIILLTRNKFCANMASWLDSPPVALSRATAYPKNILWVHEKVYFSR